jgi:hypothetical protein
MKVVWLYSRIARRSRNGDYTKLSFMEQQDVADAANAALTQLYDALPSYFKQMTEGFSLPGPKPITLSVVHNSPELSSSVFTDEQIGRSIVLVGDPNWNQVIATDRLLNPYMGPTGTANGTLYGDAVYSQRYPLDRIVGNPTFANPSLGFFTARELIRCNVPGWPWAQQVGMPRSWWTQTLGNSQGNEPLLVLRVSPAPDQEYVINVRSAYWSKRLLPQDYTDNTIIPVPDQFLESILIPLALQAFMASPAWNPGPDDNRVIERAQAALQMAKNQYAMPGVPNNRIFTPIGY